jgi:hypothetical protein
MANPLNRLNYQIPVSAATLGFNSLSSVGAQVIGYDGQRVKIIFSNPNNSSTVYVYQTQDANGNALAPSLASPGGAWPVLPGAVAEFSGDVQGNWGGFINQVDGDSSALSLLSSWSL